jgi:tyrosine-protein kinase Etk/Wzc
MNKKVKSYSEDGIDFTHFFDLLLRYKKYIFLFTAVCSGLLLVFLLITLLLPPAISPFPNVYRPVSTILVNEDPTSDVFPYSLNASAVSSKGGLSLTKFSYGELALKLINSKSILDTILTEFDIADRYNITSGKIVRSREAILKHLDAEYDDKTMIVSVSYEDYDPAFASKLTNRMVGELERMFDVLDTARNARQKNILESKIDDVRKTIVNLEAEIKRYQKKYGFLEVQSLSDERTATVAQVRVQLLNKEMEIKTKQELLRIDDPEMKKLFAERDTLAQLIKELEAGFSSYNSKMPSQIELPDVAQAFAHLERELAVQEKIYELLVQQHELSKLSLAGFQPVIQVIDRADVPDYKDGPPRTIIFCIGVIVSLILALVTAAAHNGLKHIIRRLS